MMMFGNLIPANREWVPGDCFAFIAEDDDPAEPLCWGDVLFGEVVEVLANDEFKVRVYCAQEASSSVERYERFLLNVYLTRTQMDRAAREGWPSKVAWLRALLAH